MKRQSQIITGERLPSWSIKIILIIFTTANDSPNLVYRPFDGFIDLVKRKHENFTEKQYAGVCTNIDQRPYGAFLR